MAIKRDGFLWSVVCRNLVHTLGHPPLRKKPVSVEEKCQSHRHQERQFEHRATALQSARVAVRESGLQHTVAIQGAAGN